MAPPKGEADYEKSVRENDLNTPDGVFLPSWSGRGRHVTLRDTADVKFTSEYIGYLGNGSFGCVESVECRSKTGVVRLVRKNLPYRKGKDLKTFMDEVQNSRHLKHKHVVQFVGTYCTKNTFALLQYPVGDLTLRSYMENPEHLQFERQHLMQGLPLTSLEQFTRCVANGLRYLHDRGLKHMDIKGNNIIVRRLERCMWINGTADTVLDYTVFLTDFGLARKIHSQGVSLSSGPTGFTGEYAVPELFTDDMNFMVSHTRRSDVFALSCLFAEMATTASSWPTTRRSLDRFRDFRDTGSTSAFSQNLPQVMIWLDNLLERYDSYALRDANWYWPKVITLARDMLNKNVSERRYMESVVKRLDAENCCEHDFEDCDLFWDAESVKVKWQSKDGRIRFTETDEEGADAEPWTLIE